MLDDTAPPTHLVYYTPGKSLWRDGSSGTRTTGQPRNQLESRDRAQALRAIQGSRPMLYALWTADGLIKIGCSVDIAARRRSYGTDILAIRYGDTDDEVAIHDRLHPHLARGQEYYHPHPEVLAVVNGMRAEWGLEPISR